MKNTYKANNQMKMRLFSVNPTEAICATNLIRNSMLDKCPQLQNFQSTEEYIEAMANFYRWE